VSSETIGRSEHDGKENEMTKTNGGDAGLA
jgi:hypothetical protein